MKAWLYYRLSNDDDREHNSLQNQRKICAEYAARSGLEVIDESFDDNASGMNFRRDGIQALTNAVLQGGLDAVIVKDFSRLGRHRTQTALFVDFLREQGVMVISATEQLNSFEEKDDLTIGVRGLLNDFYARDISKKVRAGYRQKQKDGIVIIPPFGYWKDKNTGEIKAVEDAAETVRIIYRLFLDGYGFKEIARQLNKQGRKTPAQYQNERYGKANPQVRRYLWSYASVKNVLTDESYIGVLHNHKREMLDGKTVRYVESQDQYRHENVYPVIISEETWRQAQGLLKQRNRTCGGSAGNKATHRYAGLLECHECGSPFVAMKRTWNGKCRVEYVCKGYHRYGKVACAPHRVHEEIIDGVVWDELSSRRELAVRELDKIKELQKIRALRKPILDARICALWERMEALEQEVDYILLEQISIK